MRLLALLLALAFTAFAAVPYELASSAHFEILAPKSPETSAVLRQLELAHAFFNESAKLRSPHARPILLMVPATETQFLRVKPAGFVYGFYVPLPGRDAVVLQGLNPSMRRAAVHEYTHLALQYSGDRYPRWLNEGLAEYYSTLRMVGSKVEFGHVLPERVQRLRGTPWWGIADLLRHGQQDRTSTAELEDTFYAQTWLLTHMLISSGRYAEGWLRFRQAILAGDDEQEAFDHVYHRSVVEVSNDLRAYFAAGRFEPQSVPKPASIQDAITSNPANEFDVEATTAAIEGWRGRKQQARKVYDTLVRTGDGECKWQRELGDIAEASGLFEDSVHHRQQDLNCRKDAVAACDLARGLGLHPSPPDALIALAAEHLKGADTCGFGFYWLGLRAGRAAQWAQAIEWLEHAKGLPPPQAEEVDRLLADAKKRLANPTNSTSKSDNSDQVEILSSNDRPPLSRMEGVLEKSVCAGSTARIDVRGKIAVFTFFVEDRSKYPGLVCGVQKRNVSLAYEQTTIKGAGAVAAVRELEFR